jgi:endonuclease/exonuclease/phosphatase (EEP) superfamily protein YafD
MVLLGLHFVVFAAYARRWDRVAIITIPPIWAWAAGACLLCLLSWACFRGRGAKWVGLLWLATGLLCSEEPRLLLRVASEKPQKGPPAEYQGQRTIRVVNLNCRKYNPTAADEVAAWHPDIVLLQESPYPAAVDALAKRLFPDGGNRMGAYDCCILTRGALSKWPWQLKPSNNLPLEFQQALPVAVEIDGKRLHVVCVHLQGAETDLSFHRLHAWQRHYLNRVSRRAEVWELRNRLALNEVFVEGPVILGGDFNAPADDAVMRELRTDFVDVVDAVGGGFCNTYPNHFPLHRIDHIFCKGNIQPVRTVTVKTVNSDHRMLIADFVLP